MQILLNTTIIKNVDNIEFNNDKDADKIAFARTFGSVNTGKYIMHLEVTPYGKQYLVCTWNNRWYWQTDLMKILQKQVKLTKEQAEKCFFNKISLVDDEVILSGLIKAENYRNSKPVHLITKNGRKFWLLKEPDYERDGLSAVFLKVGTTYVMVQECMEQKSNCEEKQKIKAGERIVSELKYFISKDKFNWEPREIKLSGVVNSSGNIEYDHAKEKQYNLVMLKGAFGVGEYLYLEIVTHTPYFAVAFSEEYLYRTKDFETYEKVKVCNEDKCNLEVIKSNVYVESLCIVDEKNQYGILASYEYDEESGECSFENLIISKKEN